MPSRRGSILICVLWSLFFLTALALVINATIVPQLTLAAALRDRFVLRTLAEAGMQRSLLELRADETEGYDALNEAWSRNEEAFKEVFLTDNGYFSVEQSLDGGEEDESGIRYGLTDEERKININTAPAGVLAGLFEKVGDVSGQEAEGIAESILDWRDADDEPMDNGAEGDYYEALQNPYPCKDSRFDILEELLLVKGVTAEAFDLVKGYLTVYGAGAVNVNTADPEVLSLLGISEALAVKIVRYRAGNDGEEATEDDVAFESAPGIVPDLSAKASLSAGDIAELTDAGAAGLLGVRSDYFRGESYGRLRDRTTAFKAVFVVDRNEAVRFWREM